MVIVNRHRMWKLCLVLVMFIATLAVTPAKALAVDNDYPWQGADPNQLSALRFYYRNCTDFVAWRLNKQAGVTSAPWRFTWSNLAGPGGNGNAIGWKDGAISRGYRVDNNPQVGSVAWWGASRGGGLGHVAIVSAVNPDGSVNIEQYNVAPHSYSTQSNVRAEAYLHIADTNPNTNPHTDVSGDGRADLALIGTGPTGSGRLEAHVLNSATGYSTWYANWATAAGYGNPTNRYLMGDINGDGRDDLVIVGTGPTGSGRLEAHVLNAATGYSTWYANWATAAGYGNSSTAYVMGDVSGDGRADLVLIGTGPTGSGRLEAHVLDAATGYSTWYANWATAADYGNPTSRYLLGDVNGDRRDDLVIVGTGPTGSGRLEAHVLDAATGYSTWYSHWATAADYGNSSTAYVMGDVSGDGRADLVLIGTGPTGSGRLEAHVLDAATGYSTWYSHWATAAGYGNSSTAYAM